MTDATASPFAGLGARAGSKPPPPPNDNDDFDSPVVQRVVPAASAPSVVPANAFVLPWRPAGSADTSTDEPAADQSPEEKTPMKKKPESAAAPRKSKKQPTRGTSARFQMCSLLMAKGDMTRDELAADVSADRQAIYNAFYNMKKDGHAVHIASTDKWHLTAAGREWTSGGANLANHKASMPPPKPTKQRQQKNVKATPRKAKAAPATSMATIAGVDVGTSLVQVVQERSFRCAVFSDGGFHLAKNGQAVDLTAAESKEMLRYLERLAEQPGA